MKIVLANIPLTKRPNLLVRYNQRIIMPHGLLSLGTVLAGKGNNVRIIDANAEMMTPAQLYHQIVKEKPDLVGFSVTTPSYPLVQQIIQALLSSPQRSPRPWLVIGGPHATLMPRQIMTGVAVDFVLTGECEFSFPALLTALNDNRKFQDVPGLYYRHNTKVLSGPGQPYVEDLDSLPPSDYSLLNMDQYRSALQWPPVWRTYSLMTSRGCPFSCTYCANKRLRERFTSHSMQRIKREIEVLITRYGCKSLILWDSVFPLTLDWGLEFCRMMVREDYHQKVEWICQSRVECVQEQFVALAAQAGCSRISLEIESGDPHILRSINKGFTPRLAIQAVELIKAHHISVSGNFMFGHIGDTLATMKKTQQLALAMDLDEASFFLFTPYPGTETFRQAQHLDAQFSHDWASYLKSAYYSDRIGPFIAPGLTADMLHKIRRTSFFKFYFRPHILWREFRRMGFLYFMLKLLSRAAILTLDVSQIFRSALFQGNKLTSANGRGQEQLHKERLNDHKRAQDSFGKALQKKNHDRLWRMYSDALHTLYLKKWIAIDPNERLLKTDLFDEASGQGLYPHLSSVSDHCFGIDASLDVVNAARKKYEKFKTTGGDVRHLPYKDETFDAIFSNSTLDHLQSHHEITVSLQEFHRILKSTGRLFISLDNLSNPVIALRQILPFRLLYTLGLVPYYVGATMGPRRLRHTLNRVGFSVKTITAMSHCPRLIAVIIARFVCKFCSQEVSHKFIQALIRWERLADYSTRFLSGYYVVIVAEKK
ncbi:radical SAM protein [candidate division CSSED10-310 bacterium]|uniref:Radical SAM protein n=1 Tax=candidate division CSSED10-310 bacterium TaxID=2855610 RepID=A0ABV6YUI3_UNCC1